MSNKYDEAEPIDDQPKYKRLLNREDREAIKRTVKKVISAARAGLEIYFAAKKKDPILLGLSAVSAYEAAENLLVKGEIETLHHRLAKTGLVRIIEGMDKLVLDTLMELGVPYQIPMMDKGEEPEKALMFTIYGVKIYILVGAGYIIGTYAKDEDIFIDAFSKLLCEKMGNVVSVNVFTENYNSHIKLSSIEIPLDTYVCQFDEKEYCETIDKFRKMDLNRSSLLYGNPGCGKTTWAAKIAKTLGGRLIVIDAQALNYASRQGWSLILQKIIRLLSPQVVLFDDIDRLGEDELGFLLSMVENLNRYREGELIIMASVNDLSQLPDAMKRPGRFDEIKIFTDPNYDQRRAILLTYLKHFKMRLADEYVDEMAKLSCGLTPAYLREIALQATIASYSRIPEVIDHMKKMLGVEGYEDMVDDLDDCDDKDEDYADEVGNNAQKALTRLKSRFRARLGGARSRHELLRPRGGTGSTGSQGPFSKEKI